ncbi:protein LIAT1 [Heteronotia binoei]|uniref:protein LIAT1 n=1 Tax=Heteronotia binoei TaxID=13085 RepID=UPI0029301FBC|nr:protein LIAT1 [Heteronotia binoei]
METCGQNLSPCGEGAKLGKTHQALGKKKTRKKKKKKKKGTQDEEKQPSKSPKQPAFPSSPEPRGSPTTEDDAAKEAAGRTRRWLFASASFFSCSTKGPSDQSNESLRWNGILDDPVAEEKRLWHYRANRRKRYDASIHQSVPPEPSLTLKHLPQLCKVAHLNGEHLLCKADPSAASSQNSKM